MIMIFDNRNNYDVDSNANAIDDNVINDYDNNDINNDEKKKLKQQEKEKKKKKKNSNNNNNAISAT